MTTKDGEKLMPKEAHKNRQPFSSPAVYIT